MSKTFELREYALQSKDSLQVDEAGGVIKGVRILGLESANGRRYAREAVAKAIGLYEGRQVNVDHDERANQSTPLERRFGWLESVRQDPDGGLRGDLHYLKSHPMAARVIESAQRRPQLMGLSHNASGQGRRENGIDVIESIDVVHSVDLVADPATVSGLNESRKHPVKKTVKALIEALKKTRPGYARALKEMADSGIVSDDQMMDDPGAKGPDEGADMPEPTSDEGQAVDHEEALRQGFRAAIIACLDDDSLDLKAKIKKITEILKTEEKMLGGGTDDSTSDSTSTDSGDSGSSDAAATESKRLRLSIKARDLAEDAGVKLDRIARKALDACASEGEVKELIKELVESSRQNGHQGRPGAKSAPARQTPVAPDQGPGRKTGAGLKEGKAPEDQKALASWLKE